MIKKTLSILEYLLVMIISLLGFLTAPLIFPLAYVLRNTKLAKSGFIWLYLDDEDGVYGAKYWKKAKGITKDTFFTAYRWSALRNPAWNLQVSLKPKNGVEWIKSFKGQLTKNGKNIKPTEVAVIMYEDKNGKWLHNSGEIVSTKYSKLGSIFLWFEKGNKLYWRCSYAGNVFGRVWVEIQLGAGKRYTFRFKIIKNAG